MKALRLSGQEAIVDSQGVGVLDVDAALQVMEQGGSAALLRLEIPAPIRHGQLDPLQHGLGIGVPKLLAAGEVDLNPFPDRVRLLQVGLAASAKLVQALFDPQPAAALLELLPASGLDGPFDRLVVGLFGGLFDRGLPQSGVDNGLALRASLEPMVKNLRAPGAWQATAKEGRKILRGRVTTSTLSNSHIGQRG